VVCSRLLFWAVYIHFVVSHLLFMDIDFEGGGCDSEVGVTEMRDDRSGTESRKKKGFKIIRGNHSASGFDDLRLPLRSLPPCPSPLSLPDTKGCLSVGAAVAPFAGVELEGAALEVVAAAVAGLSVGGLAG
jgi:hypothetical protein